MPRFIKITRSDTQGSCIQRIEEVPGIVSAELGDVNWIEPGTTISLAVVEMSYEEFDALPEFMGW